MVSRIRTLNFLPEVFQTVTNAQFLNATLDQIVDQPNTMRVQGYVGSKIGYGVNAKDYYVTEPTKTRTDYQLEPGVVFLKDGTSVAQDFISYPGIVDGLALEGGVVNDNSRLFESQFYSWESYTNLDKIINFNQYYWLPDGPEAVTISTDIIFNAGQFIVTDTPNGYNITLDGQPQGATNPVITLLRGGTYTFTVNQDSQFWIQGEPGVSGYDPAQPNVPVRDILGVSNNGAEVGLVTFTVPFKNAQDEYNFPGNNAVGVVSTTPFDQINGKRVSELTNGIDGVTALNNLTLMFYNTGVSNEQGFVQKFYDETLYDEGGGNPYTFPGTSLDYTNFEGGFYTDVAATFYRIVYVGDMADPTIQLVVQGPIPTNEKIIPQYGTQWVGRGFYRNIAGTISLIPYLSAIKDVLYYQDGTAANKVGQIRLIQNNITNRINVLTDILGKQNYTAPNGVVFTNGLKIILQGDIYPTSYANTEFYVEGVGTAIELIRVDELVAAKGFTSEVYAPYDLLPYDIGNYDGSLYIPVTPDYITIARNSIDKNAWAKTNRWFHINVINATATYNNDPNLISLYATQENKAKRPIIEFYPNIKLFNSGTVGKQPIDYIDFHTTDAFSQVAGKEVFYPDTQVYTGYNAIILGNSNPLVYTTTVTVPIDSVNVPFEVDQYITDSNNVLPQNTQIIAVTKTTTNYVLTVEWTGSNVFSTTTDVAIYAGDEQLDAYDVFDGARIVFASDTDVNVKNKIYIVRLSTIASSTTPVITLTEADDGEVLFNEQTAVLRGYYNAGKDFYYGPKFNITTELYETDWVEAQEKITVNQAPLFDVFDKNNYSFGNKEVYPSSSFEGNKLFSYGLGSGLDDPILGFPVRYSSVANVGDISFDVSLNLDSFNYVRNGQSITQDVNTGYIFDYSDVDTFERSIGWVTAVGPSVQYQVFQFKYDALAPTSTYKCDIPKLDASESPWPTIQVFINNVRQDTTNYTVDVVGNSTIITLSVPNPDVDTVVEVFLLSNEVSSSAYYTVPINLNNNPFNADVEQVNVGDIRGHYQSIFYNNPYTTGEVFGINNYNDLGNLVPYGTAIIQNSASLVLPGTFLRKQDYNLFNALMYNSKEYANFKNILINTVTNSSYTNFETPAYVLDDALDQITASKIDSDSFFWSDMLPSKAPYITNTYSFANSLDVSKYPLATIYNFDTANYNSVLVYLSRVVNNQPTITQLIRNVDYTVSTDSRVLTVTKDLLPGDQITINEYNQTYGSFVPNTPTKLGLYPSTIPSVVLDENYNNPTYFIVGHDGSYTKLYGDYNPVTQTLNDYRDQVLLEFEKRVYNNLKLGQVIPIRDYDVIPGNFRTTDYDYNEILSIYSESFLNWVGQNRITYKTQYYNPANEFTYNYNQSGNKINKAQILQGYWRGIYQYFYDTSTPDTTPWEMIGFTNKPDWWETRYGPAPYTSDNTVLWEDLANGINWNNGDPVVISAYQRPGLLQVLPVDSEGNLVSPFVSIVGNYSNQSFRRDWAVGDVGPSEFAYRRSSAWPFDLMRILALTRPANFFNLGVDLDNYRYNSEFDQWLVNNRTHLVINDIEIYGNGTAKTSYINWIVDYCKQIGIDGGTSITTLLDNLDVRLVYRVAGFSDKTLLKFYVEKSTANSTNSSLLIPDESYQVLLYENQPFSKLIFSGVVIQLTANGKYKVYGNSQTLAYFKTFAPKINGNYDNITIGDLSIQVANDYTDKIILVPYGQEFETPQQVGQFLASYSKYLESQGCVFDVIESGLAITWRQMTLEFMYWVQTGWEAGSIINLNPAANQITVNKDGHVVQPLTLQQQNFILNQNAYPIQIVDMSIVRDGTSFTAKPLNDGDTVALTQFYISNIEHGIVFDNVTLFDDIIYNLVTGLRQNRILLKGTKSAEWNGLLDASGFILNQDNIREWDRTIKYTKGAIVKYKNKYWTALKIIQANEIFNERAWKETDYDEIQKGLLPNSSTRSYEATLYYDVNKANLEQDADLLSFSLIGYRPRDYLAIADLTDITQINVYKNFIKNKGTRNSVNAFKGAQLPQGGIDYDVYENWAIKTGEYGGVLNTNFVEFKLNESLLTGNPSIVGLADGEDSEGVQQEVPLYNLLNYGRLITDPDILPTLPVDTPNTLLPSAGYVNLNDVKATSYYFSGLPVASNPLSKIYVGDYIWLAQFQGTWQIFAPTPIGTVIGAKNNNNGTANITLDTPHNLQKLDPLAIINFDNAVDGYYVVQSVVDPYTVQLALSLSTNVQTITGTGVCLKLQSQRIEKPNQINSLPLLAKEFVQNKVWVDENSDGSWAVLRKKLNYKFNSEVTKNNSSSFGTAVAYDANLGYLISDSDIGEVYRYAYDALTKTYVLTQTITGAASFGTTIEHTDDLFVISQPTGSTQSDRKIFLYQLINNALQDELILIQEPIVAPNSSITNWGSSIALSGDKNWIFVSDTANNNVYVYNKDTTTQKYELSNVLTLSTLSSGDAFSSSIATDYFGKTLVVGAPRQNYSGSINDWGYAYVFDRLYQTYETQNSSIPYVPQTFNLLLYPTIQASNVTATTVTTNILTAAATSAFSLFDPVVFTGTTFGGIFQNTVYYISSIPGGTQFTVAKNKLSGTATRTLAVDDKIIVNDTTSMVVGRPIKFYGSYTTSGITENTVYYIKTIGTRIIDDVTYPAITISEDPALSTTFQVTNATPNLSFVTVDADATLTTATGTMAAVAQTQSMYVDVNGTLLSDKNYAVTSQFDPVASAVVYTLNIYSSLTAGDIITISSNNFVYAQQLTSQTSPEVGSKFATSLDVDKYATELIIGAPFEVSQVNGEGAVYRFTNSAAKYGTITGTTDCELLGASTILINGYPVNLPAGNASTIALTINNANIPNVVATAVNGKLTIALINVNLAYINDKLNVSAFEQGVLTSLGFELFTFTQLINCPHIQGTNAFGTKVKYNEKGSFIVGAPIGTRFEYTTFDFTDDSNFNNDLVFDNNTTQFIDSLNNVGAVYMYDYLPVYNESLNNTGTYVYAQSVNALNQVNGNQPLYGTVLEFNDNVVMVGAPNFRPDITRGQVVIYNNATGEQDWSAFRYSAPVVDVRKIQNIQIYSAETNNTLVNLDYFDPLQGKLMGVVAQNIDVISGSDPAGYNSPATTARGTITWGPAQVGQLWLDTSSLRYMNYHQNDIVYNSKYWGRVFPGSDVSIYSWIISAVPPVDYPGPGTPRDIDNYSIQYTINTEGKSVPRYFYWVRNTNLIFKNQGKTLSDFICQSYIANPNGSGIEYFAPLSTNVFGLYNCAPAINELDSVLHIGYSTGNNDDVSHNSYSLIRSNYPDDFLPGLPGTAGFTRPESLYNRMLESLSGTDEAGGVVPDPYLPKLVQSGVLARPRQSFFYNRFEGLENYLQYFNTILKQYPFSETANPTFLFNKGPINPSTGKPMWDTENYWEYINWWAVGYNNNTKSNVQVAVYSDLSTLSVPTGTIAKVATNSAGLSETYILQDTGLWERIGLQNGTIQFKSSLWDYEAAGFGFGGSFFDTDPYDTYPSEETRNILRTLNEELPEELFEYRNKALILLFDYIQSETIENQNYLPWLNKTSLIDVSHTIRELRPIEVFQSDNQEFLAGYINEVKPYHVVIKDFLFKYTGEDIYTGDVTDFDLPSQYNKTYEKFISPELVFSNPNSIYEYLPNNQIWQTQPYNQWYQNYGISLIGQNNYPITTLASYLELTTLSMVVDNVNGFPINGLITIDDEQIAYSQIDLATNTITGLTRGVNGTEITNHLPGQQIYIDLPAVLMLNGGRGYANPPRVTAYIDTSIYPAPRRQAVLQANMFLDTVLSVTVIDPGEGYVVLPEIQFDPAYTIYLDSANVSTYTSSFIISQPLLVTGDLVKYVVGEGSTTVGGLIDNEFYYVRVIDDSPNFEVALYSSYIGALEDHNRIIISSSGTGTTNQLQIVARASCVTSSYPIRENNLTLRYDRTTYNSRITEWSPGNFYGSFYAGLFNNSTQISSSSISLQSTQPPIDSILASAEGAAFEVVDVEQQTNITWSSRTRNTLETYGPLTAYPNAIRIAPNPGGAPDEGTVGPTTGFYVGMPVKFTGVVIGGLVNETTYYVESIVDLERFTISTTSGGSVFVLSTATVPTATCTCLVGELTDKTILTLDYPGILQATETTATTNVVTVPLTLTGQGGTNNFYVGLPVFFTGNVFGGIEENQTYYVTTIVDNQNFTMSTTNDPLVVEVTATTASNDQVTCESTLGLNLNDRIIFNNMVVSGSPVNNFGNLVSGTTYYVCQIIDGTHFTVATVLNGSLISLANETGTCTLTSQMTTVNLTSATGSMTLNVGLPISPGQISGQQFTMYPTSQQYPGLTGGGTVGNLVTETIKATLASPVNRVCLDTNTNTLALVYNNLAFQLDSNLGQDTYTASISLTTMTVTAVAPGSKVLIGATITGTGVTAGTKIVSQLSGTTGGIGTYQVDTSQTTLSTTITQLCLVTGVPYYVIGSGVTTVTVTNTSSTGNLLTCADTTILYVNMPIEFSGTALGGVQFDFQYYVESIASATQFTIKTTLAGSAVTLTNDNGSMTGTGQAYVELSVSQGGSAVELSNDTGTIEMTQYINPSNIAEFDISYILGGYRVIVTDPGAGYTINNTIVISGNDIGGVSPLNDLTLTVNSIDVIVPNPDPNNPWKIPVESNGEITQLICSGVPNDTVTSYYFKVINENQIEVYSDPLLSVPVAYGDFPFEGIRSTTATSTTAGTDIITLTSSTGFNVNDPVVFTGDVFGGSNLEVGATYYITSIVGNDITVSETVGGTDVVLSTESGSMYVAKSGDYALLPEPFYFDQSIVKYNNKVYQCIISNNDDEFILGKWELIGSDNRLLNELDRIVGYYKPLTTDTLGWSNYINMPGQDLTQLIDGITYPNSVYLGNAFAPADEYEIDTVLQEKPFYPPNLGSVGIVYDNTKYVAIANSPTNTESVVSTNSTEWVTEKITTVPVSATDITYGNGYYVVTTHNNNTPIYISPDAVVWTSTGVGTLLTPTVNIENTILNGVTYNGTNYVAVGEKIYTSNDVYNWTKKYEFTNGLTNNLNSVTSANITFFNGLIAVGKGQQNLSGIISNISLLLISNDNGVTWTSPAAALTSSGFNDVTSGNNTIIVVGENGVLYSSLNGSSYTAEASGIAVNLNAVTYGNGLFVAVGNNGAIITSPDGVTWTVRSSGTTKDLYDIVYNGTNKFVIVGEESIILTSSNGTTWTTTSEISSDPTFYTVQGAEFTFGYGPEELVPGVVTDSMQMIVNTRPGTNWEATEYAHVGYRVTSTEIVPTTSSQVTYSFAGLSRNPAQLAIFVIDYTTGLSTSLYDTDYTIDWYNQTVTLNTPLNFFPDPDILRIDVYDVGNGDQLVKSNSSNDPIRLNDETGFSEIYLTCNYSALKTEGSGVVRSALTETNAIETFASTNSIECEDVTGFTVNGMVVFSGTTFGNIVAGTHYYVKSIDYVNNLISISATIVSGVAGPIFTLIDATGTMVVTPETTVWTDPYVQHNGTRLVLGDKFNITGTNSTTNTVVCNTTVGMDNNDPITFSDTIFGGIISPQTVYYVKNVIDDNEFTISATPGGSVISLTDATGGALAVTYDYVFGIADNGISAKIIFSTVYNSSVDYLSYTVFGETTPEQYGYTLPETELITADGSATYTITNYNDGDNSDNAIVEVNGLRVLPSTYNINPNLDTITFTSSIPSSGDVIAITTFNRTERQYFLTNSYTITSSTPNNTVDPISYVDNVFSAPLAVTQVSQVSSTGNIITCEDTFGFVVGQTAIFKNLTGLPFTGSDIQTDGTVYWVTGVSAGYFTIGNVYTITNLGNTDFTLIGAASNTIGLSFTATGSGTIGQTGQALGLTEFCVTATPGGPTINPTSMPGNHLGVMSVYIGGVPTVRVTTTNPHNFVTNDYVRIDGVVGSTQLNNNLYYVHVISSTLVDLYLTPYQPLLTDTNNPLINVANYVSGGYIFIDGNFVLVNTTGTSTTAGTNLVSVVSTTGLIPNTPVIFTGNVGASNIVEGQTYYIKDVDLVSPNTFTISETHAGDVFVLAAASSLSFSVTQWEQYNVERLWVTINGYRVPSSALRLNADNNLSILREIQPGDEVIITSMIPSATPDQETYMELINKEGTQTIYRANSQTSSWLTQDLDYTDNIIYLDDVTRVTATIVQNEVAPAAVNGVITIGLDADKRIITQIIVVNNTTATTLTSNDYYFAISSIAPVIKITNGVTAGDSVTITVIEGNTIFVNGEQIRFGVTNPVISTLGIVTGQSYTIQSIGTLTQSEWNNLAGTTSVVYTIGDTFTAAINGSALSNLGEVIANNALYNLQRGVNGTGVQVFTPQYSEVYGFLSENLLSSVQYNKTWNSHIYNPVEGDPLQISETAGAEFLNQDVG